MRAYLTGAAVTSRCLTAAQLTDGSYPIKATTCPDVSESRHSVAVTGVGGVHDAHRHQSRSVFWLPRNGGHRGTRNAPLELRRRGTVLDVPEIPTCEVRTGGQPGRSRRVAPIALAVTRAPTAIVAPSSPPSL